MGPWFLQKNVAISFEWACCFFSQVLKTPFDELILTGRKYCRWSSMSPLSFLRDAANAHEWVLCVSKDELQIALNGTTVFTERCSQSPFLLLQNTSGGHK